MSSYSARVPAATSPPSAPPSWAKRVAVVEEKYWGGVCLNVGCIPSRPCCATPNSRTSSRARRKTFGIKVDGTVTFDYGDGLPAQPQGRRRPGQGRPLPDEEEQDHRVSTAAAPSSTRTPSRWPTTTAAPAPSPSTTASSPPAPPPSCCPAPSCSERVVTYEEQILAEDLPAVDHHRRRRRDRRRVRLRAAQLRREGHHRRVPRPHGAAGGRRGLRRTGQAVPEARHRRAHLHPRRAIDESGDAGPRHRHRQGRRRSRSWRPTRCSRRSASSPERRGLRPGQDRRHGSPSAARSTSTAAAAPPCRTSTPSATSPPS